MKESRYKPPMSSFDMFGFFAPKENILPKEKKKFVCEPLVFADSVIIKETW